MEPGAVLVRVGRPVEEDHLALVPPLVALPDSGQVEGCGSVGRVVGDPGHPVLVAFAAVCWIALVPDVDRDLLALDTTANNKNNISPGLILDGLQVGAVGRR